MSETLSEKSRAEIDKIVVPEGENAGRIQDVEIAHRLAKSEDNYRKYVKDWHEERGHELGKDDMPTLTESTREGMKTSVESTLANEVMNRVVTRPKVEEDKKKGIDTGIGYHPDVNSDDLHAAYVSAAERYKEIEEESTKAA